MPPRSSHDTSVGDRIRTRRQARNWSIRFAASRAGISHTSWSRIERGLQGADNRFVVADMAAALECSIADLTGQPGLPTDLAGAEAQAGAYAVRHALADTDLREDPLASARPIEELRRDFDLIQALRRRCDDVGTVRLLPRLLRELHAAARTSDRDAAFGMLVQAAAMSSGVMRHVATVADMWMAAERCSQAAAELDDPVYLALAEYERALAAIACGSHARASTLATRAADALRPHLGRPGALEVLGMLTLECGFTEAGQRRHDAAVDHLAEAGKLAARTGDTDTLGLMFGPTNVNIWSIAIETDGGDPGRAVQVAQTTTPTRIESTSRQATFYTDTGRALSRIRGKDREAVRMLLTAERIAPRRVHASALARETTRTLLERSNRSGLRGEIAGLCERMALPA